MKDKAVFFATKGMLHSDDLGADFSSTTTINLKEWKALRLLTLAGYTIVLFIPERSTVYAECQDGTRTFRRDGRPPHLISQCLGKQITPLLHASASLQIDLGDSWMVGDKLDSIEVGRLVGCQTILLTDGNETEWEMTAMRWPDMIAEDVWETACLIVMSDGSSVEGPSASTDNDE